MALLEINNLTLSILGKPILRDIDLQIEKGEIMGLVGESGSGKSLTALSVMQLLPYGSKTDGEILFDGQNLNDASEHQMCALRGDDIGMVFQEPMTALNPLKRIGDQIGEGIAIHTTASAEEIRTHTHDILRKVGLDPDVISPNRYPHELSGGQRQRVVIAIACAMRPRLLIADEPTTALDVTVQAQILELLKDLVREFDMGLILISHDLGVVAEMADTITILRNGEVVEQGDAVSVLHKQEHPYTRQLAEASTHVPERTKPPVLRDASLSSLLSVSNLVCTYPGRRRGWFSRDPDFRAVNEVSFDILPGQTVGLVGESGCGKSTLSRTILGLKEAASGEIRFRGNEILIHDPESVALMRRDVQIVFQDPFGSFNPRHKVHRLVSEPLHMVPGVTKTEQTERVEKALLSVGLSTADMDKFPHEFSGGQRQRIAIARALVTEPRLIIADEPVSALDVSVRAQILDLFVELRERLEIAYLFVSHDLSVVRAICDEVMVMQSGRIVEHAPTEVIFNQPQTEYTRTLLAAAPDLKSAIAKRQAA